jgi:hypothetical protein
MMTSTFRARSPSSTISSAIIGPATLAISIPAYTISSPISHRRLAIPAARLTSSGATALRRRTRLFAHSTGVAKNSLHIQAEAIDLRMPGIDTFKLRKAALALHRGGVGYYPHSDFIHVDVGRVRQWCFDCPTTLAVGD